MILIKVYHSIARFHLLHKRLYIFFGTNAILIHDHIANGHFSYFMDWNLFFVGVMRDIKDKAIYILLEAPCDGILCIVKYEFCRNLLIAIDSASLYKCANRCIFQIVTPTLFKRNLAEFMDLLRPIWSEIGLHVNRVYHDRCSIICGRVYISTGYMTDEAGR